jgi:hypothetical protein
MPVYIYPSLSVLLFASSAFIPQLGVVAAVFAPLVLMLYFTHKDRTRHFDYMLAALIAGLAFFNHVLAGFFIISPLFASLYMLYIAKRYPDRLWLAVTGAAFLPFAVALIIIFGIESYRADLVEFTQSMLSSFIEAAKEVKAPMTQSPYFAQVDENRYQAALSLVLVFPAFNYIFAVFSAFISISLFTKLKKLTHTLFRLPDNAVWILIGSFALIFVPGQLSMYVGINFSFIFLTLYAFQGFEIVSFWMNKFRIIPLVKAVIFIFIFSEPPIILIISLIGLFSVWFNFYGKKPDEEQETSE